MTKVRDPKLLHCPALITIKSISGKWKTRILWLLRERPHHFSEIKHLLPGVSAKVLSEQLKQLSRDGLVTSQETKRGKVSFTLYDYTDYGKTLVPVMNLLGFWGVSHEQRIQGTPPNPPNI